jgi:hypothetical protein
LIDQNEKISAAIVDNAKNSIASAKATQRLLVTLIMKRAIDQDAKPKDDNEKPKKITDTKDEQPLGNNTNYNICFGGEEDSHRSHSNPRFTSSGRLRRAVVGSLLESCPSAGK